MQYAILFYHFCASTRLFVHPMPVLSIHHCIYQMYTFWRSGRSIVLVFWAPPA